MRCGAVRGSWVHALRVAWGHHQITHLIHEIARGVRSSAPAHQAAVGARLLAPRYTARLPLALHNIHRGSQRHRGVSACFVPARARARVCGSSGALSTAGSLNSQRQRSTHHTVWQSVRRQRHACGANAVRCQQPLPRASSTCCSQQARGSALHALLAAVPAVAARIAAAATAADAAPSAAAAGACWLPPKGPRLCCVPQVSRGRAVLRRAVESEWRGLLSSGRPARVSLHAPAATRRACNCDTSHTRAGVTLPPLKHAKGSPVPHATAAGASMATSAFASAAAAAAAGGSGGASDSSTGRAACVLGVARN